MISYILRRIIAVVPVMMVVAVFVFLVLRLGSADPAAVMAGEYATDETIARIREKLGLNEPIYVQFLIWVKQLLQGDLGVSIFSQIPVRTLIFQRIEPSLALGVTTLGFAVLVAVPLGVIAAWKAGTLIDRFVMLFSVIGFSLPVFVVGYLLISSLSLGLRILPVQGYKPLSDGLVPFLQHIALPTLALSTLFIALFARITRAAMLEVLSQDYIRTAEAKGLGKTVILFRHALKNAAVPIVTVIGVAFGLLISGVVVTETVFAIPGVGRLTADAIFQRDYPVIQGVMLFFSAIFVFVNLLVDIAYTYLDPRIRY